MIATDRELDNIDRVASEPRPSSVSFATTEHFPLQGARAATIPEATGRATMFLGAVNGGLVALGLIATASTVDAAFYAFGLILLPTLAFIGLVTFDQVLQSGIEDHTHAQRIPGLRDHYFQYAPKLVDDLLSVRPAGRLTIQGLRGGRWQSFPRERIRTTCLFPRQVTMTGRRFSNHASAERKDHDAAFR